MRQQTLHLARQLLLMLLGASVLGGGAAQTLFEKRADTWGVIVRMPAQTLFVILRRLDRHHDAMALDHIGKPSRQSNFLDISSVLREAMRDLVHHVADGLVGLFLKELTHQPEAWPARCDGSFFSIIRGPLHR